MTNKDSVDVVFGTGPLGNAVMSELLVRGKKVRMVNRSGKCDVPKGVEVVMGDACNHEDVRRVCKGAGVIYNCAKPPYTNWPEEFPPLLEGLIEGAAYSGAVLVHCDNLYMYGAVDGDITEDLPYKATGKKGSVRTKMSNRLFDAHKSGKIRMTIGRASDFYGPGVEESSIGTGIFKAAIEGKAAPVLGNVDMPHTYTYIKDFAKGLVILGESEEALGEAWHIPSDKTITTRQLISMIYKEAGTTPKFQVASRGLVTFLGIFNKTMREFKEMLYLYEKPFVVNHSKFVNKFGDHSTSHIDAIQQTFKWLKNQ